MKQIPATRSGLRLVNDRARPFSVLESICSGSSVEVDELKGEIETCVFSLTKRRSVAALGDLSNCFTTFPSRYSLIVGMNWIPCAVAISFDFVISTFPTLMLMPAEERVLGRAFQVGSSFLQWPHH